MKEAYKGTITKFLKENKPKYSPDIKKWFDNGGSIKIETIDDKQIWTYISATGDSVPYIDGYVVHHDIENGILQLVVESIHAEFTHIGGYSIYK